MKKTLIVAVLVAAVAVISFLIPAASKSLKACDFGPCEAGTMTL